ncbi:hypothetical protein [Parenemella sanctibonifatiensis]|uniref:Uncharacterized protein n=1 Tax=Parenemella sanctibonifatiensis TaxID=2016505 RepID=A0A255EG60_9ACTN|nr:hypothetical protein [Parenemella sanctibonifatiensis]OYN90519.1 hypothetical protein CGZ92_01435 [Parenemella sanctibonifatiensis]
MTEVERDHPRGTIDPPSAHAGADLPQSAIADLPGYRQGRRYFDGDPKLAVLRTDFDVADYTRQAQGRILQTPGPGELADDRRADFEFLWRVENGAISELREVISSWTGVEARITAFLATWAFERHWMAVAVRDMLAVDGEAPERKPARGLDRIRSAYVEKLLPLVTPVVGFAVREPITAGHMAKMAIHEGALQVAYETLLPELSGGAHDTVAELIERRRPMIEFFRIEAATRIRRSSAERRAAGWALANFSPLRVGGVGDADARRSLRSIFGTAAAQAALAASDATIGDLVPGAPTPSLKAVRRSLHRGSAAPVPTTATRSDHGL